MLNTSGNTINPGPGTRDGNARYPANAPLSVRAGKQTAYLSAQYSLAEAYERSEEIWAPVYRSADAQEGPAALRDKRTPIWTGR